MIKGRKGSIFFAKYEKGGGKAAYLLTLSNDRKGFLDAMYVVAPEEFARLIEVYERLREYRTSYIIWSPRLTKRRSVHSSAMHRNSQRV